MTAPTTISPPLDGRLAELLDGMLVPLAAAAGASLSLEDDGRAGWLVQAPSCGCHLGSLAPGPCPGGNGREVQLLDLECGARLWLCRPPGGVLDPAVVASVARTAAALVATEEERDGLCEELGLSFESLASIYEIGEDRSLLLDPQRACARILERIASYQEGLEAALWLLEDDELRPLQWRCRRQPDPLPREGGVAGAVLARGRSSIHHRPDAAALGPELARVASGAATLAVVPLLHSDEPVGLVGVWSPRPGAFDSRFLNLVAALANQATMIVVGDRLRRELVASERLQQEVEISARIQQSLLQGSAPKEMAGLQVGVLAISSRQIDGDFFGFFPHSTHCVDLLIGDVMGKGVPAALVGAAVKSEFKRFSNSLHATGARLEPAPTGAVVASVHREVTRQLVDLGCFVTAAYARFDTERGLLEYVDCGHTNTLHYQAARQRVVPLESAWQGRVNLPLGMSQDAAYVPLEVQFAPGDIFLFYSDGVTEAESPTGGMFGQQRLAALLQRCVHLPPDVVVARVREAIRDYSGQYGTKDDLTCLAVRITDAPATALGILEVGGAAGNLHQVHRFLDDLVADTPTLAADEELAYRVRLAVVEACTNVVRHGYQGIPGGKLRLEARRRDGELCLSIRDRGRAFDPRRAADPDLSGLRESGFGLFLIRQLADRLDYRSDPEAGNSLTLAFRLEARR